MNKPVNKSRRHFLRGAGVALALPWMESLPLFGAQESKAAAAAAANEMSAKTADLRDPPRSPIALEPVRVGAVVDPMPVGAVALGWPGDSCDCGEH